MHVWTGWRSHNLHLKLTNEKKKIDCKTVWFVVSVLFIEVLYVNGSDSNAALIRWRMFGNIPTGMRPWWLFVACDVIEMTSLAPAIWLNVPTWLAGSSTRLIVLPTMVSNSHFATSCTCWLDPGPHIIYLAESYEPVLVKNAISHLFL